MNQEVINTRIEILKALGQKSMSELTKGSELQKAIMERTGASQIVYETAILAIEIDKWATCVLSDVYKERLWSITALGRAMLEEALTMNEYASFARERHAKQATQTNDNQ